MRENYSKIIINNIIYNKHFDFTKNIDYEKLLVHTSNNRVLYQFVNNILNSDIHISKQFKNIIKDIKYHGDKCMSSLNTTLKTINHTFKDNGIDYLIVKTYKYIDYITFDVDLVVKYNDFQSAISILKKNGFNVLPHQNPESQGKHQRNCLKQGLLKIDLHRKFFWLGINHIDHQLVWTNTRTKRISRVDCPVPSKEVDFILNCKQLVYERQYITLLDFIAIKFAIKEGLDFSIVKHQIIKYKWLTSYNFLLTYLDKLNYYIYKKPILPNTKHSFYTKDIKIPLFFTYKHVTITFFYIIFFHHFIPIRGILFFIFSRIRYLLYNRTPYYDHWYNFNKYFNNKYTISECIIK